MRQVHKPRASGRTRNGPPLRPPVWPGGVGGQPSSLLSVRLSFDLASRICINEAVFCSHNGWGALQRHNGTPITQAACILPLSSSHISPPRPKQPPSTVTLSLPPLPCFSFHHPPNPPQPAGSPDARAFMPPRTDLPGQRYENTVAWRSSTTTPPADRRMEPNPLLCGPPRHPCRRTERRGGCRMPVSGLSGRATRTARALARTGAHGSTQNVRQALDSWVAPSERPSQSGQRGQPQARNAP